MNCLPTDLIEYISDFSGLLSLVNINKDNNNRFSERCKRLKQKNRMSKEVIDTLLVEMKRHKFKQSSFGNFDFYLFNNVKNDQEIDSLREWWINKYPDLGATLFFLNITRIRTNTYRETKKVLSEYISTNKIEKKIIIS